MLHEIYKSFVTFIKRAHTSLETEELMLVKSQRYGEKTN